MSVATMNGAIKDGEDGGGSRFPPIESKFRGKEIRCKR